MSKELFFTRTKSRGTTPTTQRTSLEIGRSFLHLRLWERETDEFCNLLFADLSGEAFETHIGRVDEVKQDFPFMDRADYFVGVLDGEMINNKRKRNGAVAAMIELARTFYDAELVGRGCVLQTIMNFQIAPDKLSRSGFQIGNGVVEAKEERIIKKLSNVG